MEWKEYLKGIITEPSCLDNISMSFSGEEPVCIPPVIKASILMLEKMMAAQGVHNVIVFPERIQSSFIFAISKLIHSITSGKIKKTYDPYNFAPGQKLKIKNNIMEFLRIQTGIQGNPTDKRIRIWVQFADCSYGLPVEIAPYFQLVDTNRPLSKYSKFIQMFDVNAAVCNMGSTVDVLKDLENYKTHIESSIFYVAPVLNTKGLLSSTSLNGRSIGDILLIGQADFKGSIYNVGAGQLAGIPAIVLSSDLFSVMEAVRNGASVQSIIVDVSNSNILASQLDPLDELYRMGCPIVCVTDTSDSFELKLLEDREFNIWRWDEESITPDLYGSSAIQADKKTQNCANTKIEYCMVSCPEICESLQLLNKHRNEMDTQPAGLIKIFDKLFHYSFVSLRNIYALSPERLEIIRHELSECRYILATEKKYISDDLYSDFSEVICNYDKIFADSFVFPKVDALKNSVENGNYRKVLIIIPDKDSKTETYTFWSAYFNLWDYSVDLEVLYPNEYIIRGEYESDITIVSGWLNNRTMRKILYSYNSVYYLVLLYEYEKRWKNSHTDVWRKALNNESNKTIIKESFSNTRREIEVTQFTGTPAIEFSADGAADEMDEIDLVLRENKYKQYLASGGHKSSEDTAEAFPVNFVGGYLTFYTTTHKIITATDIIVNDDDKIHIKTPGELNIGDFVVVREAQKDLIREVADSVLTASGKSHCRELAHKWKDAIEIESIFSSFDEIYDKLRAAGCTKDKPTVRRWMTDEEAIIPQSKTDLQFIAAVTEDAVLLDKLDEVFDAGNTVKSAHIKAGRIISEKLRRCIAEELQLLGDIDPYNIWDPITFTIDEVGIVKILKIMDISKTPIIVDNTNTNKLLAD